MNEVGLKDQCFGVEVEMTGITREQAATALAAYFATDARYVGGAYDKWCVTDRDGKEWTVMSDSSIHGEQKIGSGYRATGDYRYRVEMVTPKLTYAELPKLLERSGNFQKGSITGVYTVLVEGDDTNEPIADTVRGILDGHIVLSRKLANSNHFPAIDINASISRLMNDIVAPEHLTLAARVRDVMGIYEKNADLVSIGAYKAGTNPRLDYAISKIDGINQFLTQGVNEAFSYEEDLEAMRGLL